MAQNYSIIQIVGIYGPSYEALFGQVNPSGAERLNAAEAASFMKRSGLSDLLLAKIWDMSDWESRGSLDKHGWFVAMKLIALAQAGKDVSVGNLQLDVPPARFSNPDPGPGSGPPIGGATSQRRGSATVTIPASGALPTVGAMYPTLSGEDRFKFERMFDAQQPVAFQPGGKLVLLGDRVRMLLASTNLPNEILASVWNLSDVDRDGALDRDEFVILMHLVHRTMEGVALPQSIPPHLIPQSKQMLAAASEPRRAVPGEPSSSVVAASVSPGWAVPEADRAKFETMFRAIDTDSDGLVSGADCRDLLLRSGLAQPILAQIWGLCDVGNTGKLTSEQFTLAMYLVQRKVLGQEVPSVLPPELVPPSMRAAAAAGGQVLPVGGALMIGSVSISDPKLLEFKEIQELKAQFDKLRAERAAIEKQRTQEESSIRLQQNELSLLQREFESVTTTVRQLELQKGEAQKRLDELAERTRRLRASASETREHTEAGRRECDSLRNSVGSQSNNRREREEEISALRSQLNAVTQEEHALNDRLSAAHSECDRLARAIRETIANTDRVRQTISKYEEQKTQLNKIIGQLKAGQQPGSYVVNQALENIADPPELPNISAPAAAAATNFKPLGSSVEDAFSNVGASATASSFSNSKFNVGFESNSGASAFASGQRQPDPFGSSTNDPFGGDPFGFGAFDSKQPDPFGFGGTSGSSSDPFGTPTHSKSPAPPRPAKGPAGAAAPPRPAKPPAAAPQPVVSSGWPDDPFAAFGSQPADSAGQAKPATSNAAAFDAFADFGSFGDNNSPWS